AVRGASAARRARSPATIRVAASAPPSRASAAPSSALPGTPSSSRAAVISGTGSARIASSVRRRAASSATWASAARMASGSVAGERRVTRAAPSGPAGLVGVDRGGQELLERLHLGELRLGPVGAAGGGVLLGRFAAALDTATHDLGRLFVRHGVLELEFAVLEVCEDGGEEERAPL